MNIALDIGHANNTGSRGNGLEEHATAKTIADHLAPMLRAQGHAVTIIGKHAVEDIKDYLGIKASGASTWWKKALLALASAAVGMLGLSLFQGCGHSVDVTPGRTEVCKDGSCLVIEQGHISYSQSQPVTDVPPVVQASKK